MPREKQPERGVKSPYRARYKVDIGPCEGLDLAHDHSSIRDTALVQAINVRVHDGIVLSRYGQAAVTGASGMNGCVQGLIGIEGSGPRALVANNNAGIQVSGTNFAGFDIFDQAKPSLRSGSTVVGAGKYFRITDKDSVHDLLRTSSLNVPPQGQSSPIDGTQPRFVFTWWNGFPIYYTHETEDAITAEFKGPRLLKVVVPEENVTPDDISFEELFPLVVPDLGEFYPSSMAVLVNTGEINADAAPPLYFGTMDGGVYGYINGEMVELLPDSTMTGRVIVFIYNNRVYAASNNEIRFQADGWIDGGSPASTSWTAVTLPAGVLPAGVADFRPNCAAEAFGFGFVGGWDQGEASTGKGVILRLSETTLGTVTCTVAVHDATIISYTDLEYGYGQLWTCITRNDQFVSGLGRIAGTSIVLDPGYIPSDSTDGSYCLFTTPGQVFFHNGGNAGEMFSYVSGRAGAKPFPTAPQGLRLEVSTANFDDSIHGKGQTFTGLYDSILF